MNFKYNNYDIKIRTYFNKKTKKWKANCSFAEHYNNSVRYGSFMLKTEFNTENECLEKYKQSAIIGVEKEEL